MVGSLSWLKSLALSRVALLGAIALYCLIPEPGLGVGSTSARTIPPRVGPVAFVATPHGGGHEGGEHGGDGEEKFDEVSTAMAAVIMGGLAMQMVMVHFLNHRDPEVRQTTKQVVNNTVSIFCAVLFYTRIRSSIEGILEIGERAHGTVHHVWEKLGGFGEIVLLILLYVSAYADMHIRMFNKIKQGYVKTALAWAQIMAHVGGFAALYVVTDIQLFVFHRSQATHGTHIVIFLILTTLAASALQALFAFLCESARLRRLEEIEESNESQLLVKEKLEEYFLDGTKEAEADVLSFSCGFLVVQVITYCVVGEIEEFHPPHIPTAAMEMGQAAPNMLLLSCLVILALYLSFPLIRKLAMDSDMVSERALWYIRMMTSKTLAMAFAWGFLRWIDWQFYCIRHHKHRVMALATEAIISTLFAFSLIVPIDKLADWGLATSTMRTLIEVLAVMVGIAWEKTFDVAIEDLAESVSYYSSGSISAEVALKLLSMTLLAIVVPCWYWHLFPDPTSAQGDDA